MLRIDLALQEARDRQAALRPASRLVRASRPNHARRQLGVWIVRFGRAVAGHPAPHPRLA